MPDNLRMENISQGTFYSMSEQSCTGQIWQQWHNELISCWPKSGIFSKQQQQNSRILTMQNTVFKITFHWRSKQEEIVLAILLVTKKVNMTISTSYGRPVTKH